MGKIKIEEPSNIDEEVVGHPTTNFEIISVDTLKGENCSSSESDSKSNDEDIQSDTMDQSPAKKKKYIRYEQNYRLEWELDNRLKSWLCESPSNHAYCRLCERNLSVKAGIQDLIKHSITKKHRAHVVDVDETETKQLDSNSSESELSEFEIETNQIDEPAKEKYSKLWESDAAFRSWLCERPKNHAYCKLCNINIKILSGRRDLLEHSISKLHFLNGKPGHVKRTVPKPTENDDTLSDDDEVSNDNGNDDEWWTKPIKRKYKQKYLRTWEMDEKLKPWLCEKPKNTAFCRVCDKTLSLSCGKQDLVKHSLTNKHIRNWNMKKENGVMPKELTQLERNVLNAEVHLREFCSERNLPSIQFVHLLREIFPDSEIAQNIFVANVESNVE